MNLISAHEESKKKIFTNNLSMTNKSYSMHHFQLRDHCENNSCYSTLDCSIKSDIKQNPKKKLMKTLSIDRFFSKNKSKNTLKDSPFYESKPMRNESSIDVSTMPKPFTVIDSRGLNPTFNTLPRELDMICENNHYRCLANTLTRSNSEEPPPPVKTKYQIVKTNSSLNYLESSVPLLPPKLFNSDRNSFADFIKTDPEPIQDISREETVTSFNDVFISPSISGKDILVDRFQISELAQHETFPIVVRVTKGYCLDDDEANENILHIITEGDMFIISNIEMLECVKFVIDIDYKEMLLPLTSTCKFLLLPENPKYDKFTMVTLQDILALHDTPDRIRTVRSFYHSVFGLINTGTMFTIFQKIKYGEILACSTFNISYLELDKNCGGMFSLYINETEQILTDLLSFCHFPQRVMIIGNHNTGFDILDTNGREATLISIENINYFICNELLINNDIYNIGKAMNLPLDDEITVEIVKDIKVTIEDDYDFMRPDKVHKDIDRKSFTNDLKHRFYEKEISNIKQQKKRLEFTIKQLEKKYIEYKDRDISQNKIISKLEIDLINEKIHSQNLEQKLHSFEAGLNSEKDKFQVLPLTNSDGKFQNLTLKQMQQLGVDQMFILLIQLKLGQYSERFREECINGDMFLQLDDQILNKELKVTKMLDRKRILRIQDIIKCGQSISNYLTNDF